MNQLWLIVPSPEREENWHIWPWYFKCHWSWHPPGSMLANKATCGEDIERLEGRNSTSSVGQCGQPWGKAYKTDYFGVVKAEEQHTHPHNKCHSKDTNLLPENVALLPSSNYCSSSFHFNGIGRHHATEKYIDNLITRVTTLPQMFWKCQKMPPY